MHIWFYAPLKQPDHPAPSGDRVMANLLIKAMRTAGHHVELVSRFRSFTRLSDNQPLLQAAREEAKSIDAAWEKDTKISQPEVWFTYHPYYKAPDLIGPQLAQSYGMAYVTAEASFAGKRDRDEWAQMQAVVKSAVKSAAMNFCFTPIDREGLLQLVPPECICDLPPFIDASDYAMPVNREQNGPVRLVTTAMMRPGVKLQSYQILSQALTNLVDLDWTLKIVGDGPERGNVEKLFAQFPIGRIEFAGELSTEHVATALKHSDVFVWPGIGEAYGLAYLEAQGCGLPVVAVDNHGVPSVVRHDETGLLSPSGDLAAFTANLHKIITGNQLRNQIGQAANKFVHSERTIDVAAGILDQGLQRAIQFHNAG